MKFNELYILVVLLFAACEGGPFPSETKNQLPDGHVVRVKTAFHKEALFYPYGYDIKTGESNCASSRCHQPNLRGGIARDDNGVIKYAPSCYQCHTKLWFNSDSIKVK